MTSASINNFVGDLVAMATAMERLPGVEAERDEWSTRAGEYADTIAKREESILGYKAEIETLNQRIRSLEVERDDAGFRALELEDKVQGAIGCLRSLVGDAGSFLSLLDPPKPEPVAEPQPEPVPQAMPVSVDLTQDTSSYGGEPGQSATDPTATSETMNSIGSETAVESGVGAMVDASSNANPEPSAPDTTSHRSLTEADLIPEPKGKYHGLKYWDIPQYIHILDWLDNGGSEADYYERKPF